MKKPILSVNSVSYSYTEKPDVLQHVSFILNQGERVALIGPNGSGKTTLFLLLCGILKSAHGSVHVNGKPIRYNSFNPQISYLFQSPDDQLFSATLFDDVAFGPLHMGLSKQEVKKHVMQALKRTGCGNLAERPPHHLSGGEKRMAAMATILSMLPRILLLDEPTSNLDALNRRKVISTINSLHKSMLIASHDLEFLLETCSRVILIDEGKIICQGPIRELMANEKLMQAHHLEKPHSLIPHKHYNRTG